MGKKSKRHSDESLADETTLISELVHDYNNLLCPILTYQELIHNGLPDGGHHKKMSDSALKITKRLIDMNTQILSMYRRNAFSSLEIVDISNLLKDIIDLTNIKRDLGKFNFSSRPGLCVKGRNEQLQRVFLNLIINASDAMKDTEPKCSIISEYIHIKEPIIGYEPIPNGKYVKISVIDNGSGIQPEDLNSIFLPFFSTKENNTDRYAGGSGLGLCVAYRIVKDHKGFINVQSEIGKGTTFTIYLPICHISDKSLNDINSNPKNSQKNRNALIIDCGREEVKKLQKQLENIEGFKVINAPIEMAQSIMNETDVDIVLLTKEMGQEVLATFQPEEGTTK